MEVSVFWHLPNGGRTLCAVDKQINVRLSVCVFASEPQNISHPAAAAEISIQIGYVGRRAPNWGRANLAYFMQNAVCRL